MLNQKKVEIFLVKFRKPPTKQFLEVALSNGQMQFAHTEYLEKIVQANSIRTNNFANTLSVAFRQQALQNSRHRTRCLKATSKNSTF